MIKNFSALPFENCGSYKGNCTIIQKDGAIGSQSVNSVWIQGGYLDYGARAGCPYKNNTCPNGFSYFGWTKFKAYPSSCDEFGVVVSTEVFNIHILGNGHLAVYAWLPNGTEYYAESLVPVMLNIYYPIMVQFQYFSTNNTWRLVVLVQSQLFAGAITGRPRTYTPPVSNLLFGGSGNGSASRNASVQLDRILLDSKPVPWEVMYQALIDVSSRQTWCARKGGVLTQPLTCYYVETAPLNWTKAYSSCSSFSYTAGYPYGRLAWFPSWNTSVWNSVMTKLATYGNGSTRGYNAWIGGGHKLQWLNSSMEPVGVAAVVPPGVRNNITKSTAVTCLQVTTKTAPWQWSEANCSTAQKYVCQMSCNSTCSLSSVIPANSRNYCFRGLPGYQSMQKSRCLSADQRW